MVLHIIVCDCGCVLHFNHIYHIKLDIHYNLEVLTADTDISKWKKSKIDL